MNSFSSSSSPVLIPPPPTGAWKTQNVVTPRLAIASRKLSLMPCTIAAITITTSTPIVTPRIVSPLRTLLALSESIATRTPSRSVANSPMP
jgi:hypothetical protein